MLGLGEKCIQQFLKKKRFNDVEVFKPNPISTVSFLASLEQRPVTIASKLKGHIHEIKPLVLASTLKSQRRAFSDR